MRSSQSADSSALAALKLAAKAKPSGAEREGAKKFSAKAAEQISDESVRTSFLKIVDYLRQRERLAEIGQSIDAPADEILTIGKFGLVRSAEFVARELGEALSDVP